jgi:hypothetical protein
VELAADGGAISPILDELDNPPSVQSPNEAGSIIPVQSIVYITLASTFALALIVLFATFAGIYGYRLSQYVHSVDSLVVTPMSNVLSGPLSIQTGDLILFSSRLNAIACIPTMAVTKSPITHLGVVVRNPATQLLYIVEITLEGLRMTGCGLANLEARMSLYCGLILWRKLYHSSDQSEDSDSKLQQAFDQKAFQLAQHCVQRNFGYRYSFLLTMWNRIGPPMTPMPVDFDDSVDQDWICTDLVAWILERLTVFLVAPVTLLPRDFHSITQRLPMNPDYYYGPELRLK